LAVKRGSHRFYFISKTEIYSLTMPKHKIN
jgi:hypothetical protein